MLDNHMHGCDRPWLFSIGSAPNRGQTTAADRARVMEQAEGIEARSAAEFQRAELVARQLRDQRTA